MSTLHEELLERVQRLEEHVVRLSDITVTLTTHIGKVIDVLEKLSSRINLMEGDK